MVLFLKKACGLGQSKQASFVEVNKDVILNLMGICEARIHVWD